MAGTELAGPWCPMWSCVIDVYPMWYNLRWPCGIKDCKVSIAIEGLPLGDSLQTTVVARKSFSGAKR